MKLHDGDNNRLRDLILGGQDGLVNVLGNVLAVATATSNLKIVLIAGLAATFAESISMAAVAYTSFKAARDYHKSLVKEELKDIKEDPEWHKKQVEKIYKKRGFSGSLLGSIVKKVTSTKKLLVKTLVKEEFGNVEIENPLRSAFVVGLSATVGSLIPLMPFFLNLDAARIWAVGISAIALFIAGAYKAKITTGNWKKSGLEIMAIGMGAAAIGYLIGLILSYL